MNDAFQKALRKVLKSEGYYVNDPADKGGETYQGIARVYHPTWPGWPVIDEVKRSKGGRLVWNYEIKDDHLRRLVAEFYERIYWKGFRCDQINDPNVAAIVFDFCMGSGKAVQVLQRMLNQGFGHRLPIDNHMGAVTVAAINACPGAQLFEHIKQSRIAYYRTLGQSRFLQGWINRVNRYKYGEFQP